MSFLSLEDIDSRYEELVRRMDDHISTLTIMQRQMETELRIANGNVMELEYPITSSDEEDNEYDDYHYLSEIVVQLGLDDSLGTPHVRFDEEVVEIEDDSASVSSVGTVRNDSTPFDYIMLSDDESDTDTIVPEWKDPIRSPDNDFFIHGRHLVRASP